MVVQEILVKHQLVEIPALQVLAQEAILSPDYHHRYFNRSRHLFLILASL